MAFFIAMYNVFWFIHHAIFAKFKCFEIDFFMRGCVVLFRTFFVLGAFNMVFRPGGRKIQFNALISGTEASLGPRLHYSSANNAIEIHWNIDFDCLSPLGLCGNFTSSYNQSEKSNKSNLQTRLLVIKITLKFSKMSATKSISFVYVRFWYILLLVHLRLPVNSSWTPRRYKNA